MSPISDMLVRIKNAQASGADSVIVPFSKMKLAIASVLQSAGYLESVERRAKKGRKSEHENLELGLRFVDGAPVINGIKIISRPSRHLYTKVSGSRSGRSGRGIAVMSTPRGIMTSPEARKQNVGGEILFEIW